MDDPAERQGLTEGIEHGVLWAWLVGRTWPRTDA